MCAQVTVPMSLPVSILPSETYQEIMAVFQERGISCQNTPILRPTPHGDLVCYLREEIYQHTWEIGGTTYYYPISLGYFPVPVYFRPTAAAT